MLNKRLIFLTAFFLFSSISTICQEKPITEGEFFSILRKASALESESSRRVETKSEVFLKGKVTETKTTLDEIIKPDRRRFVSVEKRGVTVNSVEIIQIANVFYRRENNGRWKIEQRWMGSSGVRGIPASAKSKFTFEETTFNGNSVKVFHWLSTYKDFGATEKDPFRFSKESYWVDQNGKQLKQESSVGFVEPYEISFLETTVYQYNPKVEIKAPKIN